MRVLAHYFLRKTGSIFYAKHVNIANWPKLTVSEKLTTEGSFKNLHRNKLWFCCSQLVTFSYTNGGTKIIKQKLEIWKLKIVA